MRAAEPGHDISDDGVLGGAVRLAQARGGYRAGVDAALLAAACRAGPSSRVLDVGCGAGAVMLAAAVRNPRAQFVGLERDPAALSLAEGNIARNDLQDRVSVIAGDVGAPFAALGLRPFDLVLSNPPFFDDAGLLRPPAPARRASRLNDHSLGRWIGFLVKATREKGAVIVIHRADRLADLLAALAAGSGSVQVRPVHAFADAAATRVVIRSVKTGKAPLRLLPPLILHPRGGDKHTEEAEAILRGRAALEWPPY